MYAFVFSVANTKYQLLCSFPLSRETISQPESNRQPGYLSNIIHLGPEFIKIRTCLKLRTGVEIKSHQSGSNCHGAHHIAWRGTRTRRPLATWSASWQVTRQRRKPSSFLPFLRSNSSEVTKLPFSSLSLSLSLFSFSFLFLLPFSCCNCC
jgi:hypothetical protein